jgi:hypothetical protein
VSTIGLETSAAATEFLPRSPKYQYFRRYCKNNFFVKETGLRAVVDSVIIIFKICNQDIVAMCIMGCGKRKFRNTPLVNSPVEKLKKITSKTKTSNSQLTLRFDI